MTHSAGQISTREPALEPSLPICDAHHHLWHGGPDRRERYLFDDWLADLASGHNIVSTVFVECDSMYRQDGPEEMRAVGEIEFANGVAAMSASGQYGPVRVAAGIVGHVALTLGAAVDPVLQAHMRASPRFRGIRYSTCWDARADELKLWKSAPEGLLFDPQVRAALACLQQRQLSFDAWMLFPQLPDLVELARAMPDLQIVMGHVGGLLGIGPYSRHDEVLALWRKNIAAIAGCPNISIKLGGIGIGRLGFGWHKRDVWPSSEEMARVFEPYVLHCIEQFGVDRCMFESNFPVDSAAASYSTIWNTFKRITRNFSDTERAALFHDTATRFYRLA
jgi:L-fuconolactonase